VYAAGGRARAGAALAGLRGLDVYARASAWSAPIGRNLIGARVTIVGGGGICDELRAMLEPFDCEITVVRRNPSPLAGVTVLPAGDVLAAVANADVVVLALALTAETAGMVDARFLDAMPDHAWLVNVARGAHVVTDHLGRAARPSHRWRRTDVTDPSRAKATPWHLPNCIITPHLAHEMGLLITGRRPMCPGSSTTCRSRVSSTSHSAIDAADHGQRTLTSRRCRYEAQRQHESLLRIEGQAVRARGSGGRPQRSGECRAVDRAGVDGCHDRQLERERGEEGGAARERHAGVDERLHSGCAGGRQPA
jgi:hypothetical protein